MTLIKSLFLGESGNYNILGTPIKFQKNSINFNSFSDDFVGRMGDFVLKSRVFHILTFGYIHTLVHEMGHALAAKVLSNSSARITINTTSLSGVTSISNTRFTPIKSSLIDLGGPLTDVIFSCTQIFFAFLLSPYISTIGAMSIALGASIWIFGELFYAVDALKSGRGDFAGIARNGTSHLIGASSIMLSSIALGIFATYKFP